MYGAPFATPQAPVGIGVEETVADTAGTGEGVAEGITGELVRAADCVDPNLSKVQVVLVLFKWGILTEGCLLVSQSSE